MRVFVSGPQQTIPDLLLNALNQRTQGTHTLVYPAPANRKKTMTRVLSCDMIIMLPGWAANQESRAELDLAVAVRMPWLS